MDWIFVSNILATDIQNPYLGVPTKEKVNIVTDSKFGSDQSRSTKIVIAIYGLRTSEANFRDFLLSILQNIPLPGAYSSGR